MLGDAIKEILRVYTSLKEKGHAESLTSEFVDVANKEYDQLIESHNRVKELEDELETSEICAETYCQSWNSVLEQNEKLRKQNKELSEHLKVGVKDKIRYQHGQLLNAQFFKDGLPVNGAFISETDLRELERLSDLGELMEIPKLEPAENISYRFGHRGHIQVVVEKEGNSTSFTVKLKESSRADIYGRISEHLYELRQTISERGEQ